MLVKKLRIGWLHKCGTCGAEFSARKERKFCSWSCAGQTNNNWAPGYGETNPNWKGGTDASRKRQNLKHNQWRHDNPLANAAHRAVQYARMYKGLCPTDCEICRALESINIIEGHHQDYIKPLDVNWLCIPCHVKIHQAVTHVKELAHVG